MATITLTSGKRYTLDEWEALTRKQQVALMREQSTFKGKKHTEDAKRKNAEAHTGKKQSAEVVAKRMAAHVGAKRSEETKAKMRESRAKQVITHSDETRAKLSAALKGRKRSPETRAKMRAAQARRNAERLAEKQNGVSK
jgi:hypothetical protein